MLYGYTFEILQFETVDEVKERLEYVERNPYCSYEVKWRLRFYIDNFDERRAEAKQKWEAFGKYMNLPE